MFYFLILTGSACLLFGLYSRKKQVAGSEPLLQAAKPDVQEEARHTGIEEIRIRMDHIEKLVFQSLMVHAGRKAEAGSAGMEGEGPSSGQMSADRAAAAEDSHGASSVPLNGTGSVPGTLKMAVKADSAHDVPSAGASSYALPAHEEGFTPMAVEAEAVSRRRPMPDNVRAIADYEKQGLSVQEIVNVTRMKKGEVLLLKNLSKHYSR